MEQGGAVNSTPPIIGLTGGIGSGKSTVAQIFEKLGCIVANADLNAKEALQSEAVRQQVVDWWGESILDSDGTVSTTKVAAVIFEDEEERKRLEALLHPLAYALQVEQFAQATSSTNALIIDAPLLIEAGLDSRCDAIVFVDCSPEIRLKRVEESRGWTIEDLKQRESAQLPLDTKRKKADYIVINEGDLDGLQPQVEQILEDFNERTH
ncbi:dephospho-CoA kinase [bacterium]|nr:dephospho-CoA kinase [bacterium]